LSLKKKTLWAVEEKDKYELKRY